MLSQLKRLTVEADGRYATDTELKPIVDYIHSYQLRLQAYQALRELEPIIVQQTHQGVQSLNPLLLRYGNDDITNKWKQDVIRTLRYTAIAVLLDDPDTLRERFLLWFQTIMRSFSAHKSCNATYLVMQQVIQKNLAPAQAELVCSILELNRRYLGMIS